MAAPASMWLRFCVACGLLRMSLAEHPDMAKACDGRHGDFRGDAAFAAECRGCFGEDAVLIFQKDADGGIGYTSCHPAAPADGPDFCGHGRGDVRAAPGGAAACVACKGEGARLVFTPDVILGVGLTTCQAPEPAAAPATACGQGKGDVRGAAGSADACVECKGEGARLVFQAGSGDDDDEGFTSCEQQADADAPASTPALRGARRA